MADRAPITFTNTVDYAFDEVGFDQRLRLILVETKIPNKLTAWFDACPVLAIHQLARQSDSQPHRSIRPWRYLALMTQSQPIPQDDPDIHQTVINFQQAEKQEISTDTLVLLMIKALKQGRLDSERVFRNWHATDRLLLVSSQMKNTVIAVEVDLKENILTLKTRTFKAVQPSQENGFVINNDCLKRTTSSKEKLWNQYNLHGEKNSIAFFALNTLDDFMKTRLGLQNDLLRELKQVYGDCFRQQPHFRASEVIDYLPKAKVTVIEQAIALLKGQQLHFVSDPDEPNVSALVAYLTTKMRTSPRLLQAGVTVSVSDKAIPGFNIQVVLNQRDPHYQVSNNEQIIQHLTFERFGVFDDATQQYQWQGEKQADLMNDTQFFMTVVQLLIKRDVLTGKLCLPTAIEAEFASHFRYLYFEKQSKNSESLQLSVTRLTIASDGGLQFEDTCIQGIPSTSEASEFQRVARRVWEASGKSQSQLLGAIQSEEGVFAIYRSDLTTVPDAEKIKTQMIAANEDNRVSRQKLLTVANGLTLNGKYLGQQQQLVEELTQLNMTDLTVRDLRKQFKMSWRNKVMTTLNDDFYKSQNQWLHLPIRQNLYASYWTGTYGMGLLELNGDFYYFIGRNSSLELQQKRAVPLKRLVAIDSEQPNEDIRPIFHELESLMQVGFVRLNQSTVIPFPFKYLREYKELQQHREKQAKAEVASESGEHSPKSS
ncbi:hypothetical protein [Levilactobacillus fujinensis]|uniref:DUF2357 domain-containing protein n=1 Tax=Levilactobacillus fujinensis TaxID=2486024 RepID=A0ABW1TEC4_9LACO|nr:hypothetical protein [Levilactobacillus fujinensis]